MSEWTPTELFLLKDAVKRVESISTINVKLPNRTPDAIKRKIYDLGLTKVEKVKTIERLEAELKLKKAQAEHEAALQRYNLFAEQCRSSFVQALKYNDNITLSDCFKQNAKEFSKLNGAITNSSRKILEARIELELS